MAKPRIDRTGRRYGRLLITGAQPPKWAYLCDCGETGVVRGGDLQSGKTRSCGCLRSEMVSATNKRRRKVDLGEARALREEGMTFREIGVRFGVTRQAASRALRSA